MTTPNIHNELREQLQQLQAELQLQKLWSSVAPDPKALESTVPFMYDTLKIHEWLQWVYIPRLHALIDADGRPQPTLRVLGSLRIGRLWESLAIPELRGQAAQAAALLG